MSSKEYMREYNRKRKEKLKSMRVCVNCCVKKVSGNHVLCDDCRKDRRNKARLAKREKFTKHQKFALEMQNNECAICGKKMKIKNLDHDHKTGTIRAYLCTKCNTGLGKFDDDPKTLAKAIVYLYTFNPQE